MKDLIMRYRLYYAPGACSLAAHIVLREVGADFDLERVSVRNGTLEASYFAINPKGFVPALAIDGEDRVLTELPAILVFLARRYSEVALLPSDPTMEARCHEWIAWLSGWVHAVGFALLWRPGRFSSDSRQHEALTKQGFDIVRNAFNDIEAQFTDGRNCAVPDTYSIVDPFLLVLYRWGNRIGIPMASNYRAWTQVSYRTAARPAVLGALRQERISIEA
jgi:glutathione S-transferase